MLDYETQSYRTPPVSRGQIEDTQEYQVFFRLTNMYTAVILGKWTATWMGVMKDAMGQTNEAAPDKGSFERARRLTDERS